MGVRLDAFQVHAVLNDGDDEGADEGAEHAAFAAGQAGAADHDSGDDIEFVHQAIGGGTAFQL